MLPLVDRVIPGGLEKYLADAYGKGESTYTIAERLHAEHDVEVSAETVRTWGRGYGLEKATVSDG